MTVNTLTNDCRKQGYFLNIYKEDLDLQVIQNTNKESKYPKTGFFIRRIRKIY